MKKRIVGFATYAASAASAAFAAFGALVAATAASPAMAADIGVSVQISQPGVYGRIDIGQFPQPQVWVPQPVLLLRFC